MQYSNKKSEKAAAKAVRMRKPDMVRMKDVAEHAGVSVATVSNVITGKNFVSPAVKKK